MILSHQNTHSNVMCAIMYSMLAVLHKSFHVRTHRGAMQSSQAADKDVPMSQKSSTADLATFSKTANKADPRSSSPHGKRASPLTVREPGFQYPPKPPRLTPSPTPSVSPLLKRRKAEAGRTSPALKVNIPTILVEDEPMEVDCDADRSRRKEGKVRKSHLLRTSSGLTGRSGQTGSPEEGRTTEDSGLCESLDKAATSADKFSDASYQKL